MSKHLIFQQPHLVLKTPHQAEINQYRKCNKATWSLVDLCVAFSWLQPSVTLVMWTNHRSVVPNRFVTADRSRLDNFSAVREYSVVVVIFQQLK